MVKEFGVVLKFPSLSHGREAELGGLCNKSYLYVSDQRFVI